ncbi:MAG: hypothetical protein C5B51_21070 [Terriglobia bacterium]|nr:MAG: hypothetical protein C5B51_21070 [Terriglobia bacterium]
MDIPAFAAEQARRRLERLAFQVSAANKSLGAEAVHELRVAIRRCTQALTVFKACFPRRELKKVRRELKQAMTAAGPVRDCDIAVELLSKTSVRGAGALSARFRSARKSKEKALAALVRRWSARRSISKWCEALELNAPRSCDGTVESTAGSMLRRLGKEYYRCGEKAAARGASGEELHEFRIFAKKFRYSIELFSSVYPGGLEEQTGQVKEIQSLLGTINDYNAVRTMVQESGKHPELQAALKKSQKQKVRKFRKLWTTQFPGSGDAKRWIAQFDSLLPSRKPVARAKRPAVAAATAAKA